MKKEAMLIISLVLLFSAGAFAATFSAEKISGTITEEVSKYIEYFIEKEGVTSENVDKITEIDQSNLPAGADLRQIDKNNIGIYEVNYTKEGVAKRVFVVTYSTNEFEGTGGGKTIQSYVFGYGGIANESDYLDSTTGVKTGVENGYVMLRQGSVTGISTSMELSGKGSVYVKVYKNGEDTGFGNLISSEDKQKIDYDLQSEGVITFEPGDILSVYVEIAGEAEWGNVITTVEATS